MYITIGVIGCNFQCLKELFKIHNIQTQYARNNHGILYM